MKKYSFPCFMAIWSVSFAVFHLIALPVAGMTGGFGGSFWIGYALCVASFLLEILCARYAFRVSTLQKMFYRLPLVDISYRVTIGMAILGGVFMVLRVIPQWIAGVVCLGAFLINVVVVLRASAAAEIVDEIDTRVKTQSAFIRNLTADALVLIDRAKTDETKNECKKVYEALRYCDPLSCEALAPIDEHIFARFSALSQAVAVRDSAAAENASAELQLLLRDRNQRCKILK